MSIEKCFSLSTAHMPDTAPCFGQTRACSHEYGWIVFLAGDCHVDESLSPFVEPWLRDIYRHSVEKGCVYIVFDCDAEVAEGFKTYGKKMTKSAGPQLEKGGHLTVVAGNAEIIVKHDDDGVAVDIWPLEDVKTDGPLGSTWVTHNELQGDEC